VVRRLAELTWPEVEQAIARGAGVILPIGATEQHGLHMPLATDALLAADLADAVAEATDCLVAPAVAYGYRSRPQSGGGQLFVGTTSVSGETLTCLLRDVVREFLRHGFRRIVLLNWHMENQNFIYEGAWLAMEGRTDAGCMVVEAPFADLSPQAMELLFDGDFPGWPAEHAGIMETSLMLHLHPDLVHMERAVDDRIPRPVPYDVLPIRQDHFSRSGSLWKTSPASAAKGRVVWDEIVPPLIAGILKELPRASA
jgi:creatinine amidohydrolase